MQLNKVGAIQFQLKLLKKELDKICIKPNIIEESVFLDKVRNPAVLSNSIDD
jgi:hypothetical protein